MQLNKNKVIYALVILTLVVGAILITIFGGKPTKIIEGNFSFAKLNGEILNYYDREKQTFSELNLKTLQVTEGRMVDQEILAINWAADSTKAILTITEGDGEYFWYIDIKGEGFNKLSDNITKVSWSPSSDKIVYLNQNEINEIFISNPDGSDAVKVFTLNDDFEPGDGTVSISPDLSKVALTIAGTDVGPSKNYIVNIAANEIKPLPTELNGPIGEWASDSNRLLCQVFAEGTQTYTWAIFNAETDEIIRINFKGSLNWTQDNQFLYGTDGKAVYRYNSITRRKSKLYKGYRGVPIDVVLSVDGKKNVYFLSDYTLYKR